jgi:3-methyladenine DNA glycosylase/8-oxoguanine DNA glycosylase
MIMMLDVPAHFNFWRTVYSHGWCALPPFHVDKKNNFLERVIELPSGKILIVQIHPLSKKSVEISVNAPAGHTTQKSVTAIMRSCLRIGEDFSEFYAEAKKHEAFRWISGSGAGRLLRTPTVFEDAVKMICTTNCSWALTEIMVGNLCMKLGSRVSDSRFTFPAPDAIADTSEKYLRKEIRAGYRAPYILELSKRVAKGSLDIESWRVSSLPTEELFKEVRSVKGIGPYAAGNILKLLGRYDYLGIDSWCRKKFFEIHREGRTASDKYIERYYKQFGRWRGLFFWMDVTKHWYDQKFPF